MTDDSREVLDLVRSAATGDQAAVESLLVRFRPGLEGYLARRAGGLVRARESVADLAQSVCREVLERLRDGRLRFQGEPQFRSWLYRAAVMKVLMRERHWRSERRDAGRERPREVPAGDRSEVLDLALDPGTPSQDALLFEELDRFRQALAALPDAHREAIVLHHLEGLSHAEIAERMGVTPSYSRALLSRALARLARLGGATPS